MTDRSRSGSIERPGPKSEACYAAVDAHTGGLSSQARLFPVAFQSGSGVYLDDVDGNRYLDFSSGIYVASLGHCHPVVSGAVADAAHQLMNCHDFPTPARAEAQRRLAEIAPGDLSIAQFYDSGTTAVEAALRVARVATGRRSFIGFDHGFHGKTLGAASLGTPDPWKGIRADGFVRVPGPYPYRPPVGVSVEMLSDAVLAEVQLAMEAAPDGVAAVLIEPVQGWGGSIVPPDDFLPRLSELCTANGTMLIADEVLTCFGRTGRMFAVNHWGVEPDLMTLGKGLGNGFPVSAVMARSDLREAMNNASASTSYGGNPMACAAILASLSVIEDEELCQRAEKLGALVLDELRAMQERHPIIGEVRGLGFLLGIELVKDRATKEPATAAGTFVYQEAFRRGLAWIPAGHILRLAPPLVISQDEAFRGLSIIEQAIAEAERRPELLT
ncbi:MAG: aspartate aminotransferase family protein [Ilumatobacteraceae bacterium]